MGSENSKNVKNKDNSSELTSPNIQYMIINHGPQSCKELRFWVDECGSPATGCFSIRQLQLLKAKLNEKEAESQQKKRIFTKRKVFSALCRDRRTKAGTVTASSDLDLDLDSALP